MKVRPPPLQPVLQLPLRLMHTNHSFISQQGLHLSGNTLTLAQWHHLVYALILL